MRHYLDDAICGAKFNIIYVNLIDVQYFHNLSTTESCKTKSGYVNWQNTQHDIDTGFFPVNKV